MNKLLLALTMTVLALPASATPRAIDGGQMVDDPYFGWSRLEAVRFCLDEVGVDTVDNLITDTHFEVYESCMTDNT